MNQQPLTDGFVFSGRRGIDAGLGSGGTTAVTVWSATMVGYNHDPLGAINDGYAVMPVANIGAPKLIMKRNPAAGVYACNAVDT